MIPGRRQRKSVRCLSARSREVSRRSSPSPTARHRQPGCLGQRGRSLPHQAGAKPHGVDSDRPRRLMRPTSLEDIDSDGVVTRPHGTTRSEQHSTYIADATDPERAPNGTDEIPRIIYCPWLLFPFLFLIVLLALRLRCVLLRLVSRIVQLGLLSSRSCASSSSSSSESDYFPSLSLSSHPSGSSASFCASGPSLFSPSCVALTLLPRVAASLESCLKASRSAFSARLSFARAFFSNSTFSSCSFCAKSQWVESKGIRSRKCLGDVADVCCVTIDQSAASC